MGILGVVGQYENGEIFLSYLKRMDKNGLHSLFSEEAEINLTHHDQVIACNTLVKYSLTGMIRCILNDKIQKEIN